MAHLALYRAYRPQDFDSVVGQRHIVQTVRNQIKSDLLSHAYVLTGPRGTGKTSIARIVAKAINCTNPKNGNPCSSCESCLAVSNGSHPDVLELDAATNNGVDEIRDLRARVKYSPSLSQYKVYIIDEVHMLSTGAFNALLKTLEEPPPHVIFMLATTEIHKVPDTILSRVQRFDLKQIPSQDMSNFLTQILDELGEKFEGGVPELITTLAAGGMRDALSMLDQAIAYKTDILKLSDIHDLNGSVGTTALVEMMECVITSNFTGIVESTRALLISGKLPTRIIDGLLGMLRDVLKAQKVGSEDVVGLADKLNSEQVLTYIKKLNSLAYDLKIATDAELILEIGLIELGLEGNAEDLATPVSMSASAQQSSDYSIEIKALMRQMNELQAELSTLKSQQRTGLVIAETPVMAGPEESGMPIYVQGELVGAETFANSTEEASEQSVDTNVLSDSPMLIEAILADATKQDKMILQNKISGANPFAKLDIKEIVMLLKDAEIAAASATGCILVYDYETTAQKLLVAEVNAQAYRILTDMMGKPYGFLALPKDFWLMQRERYVAQSKQGETPILEQYPQCVEVKVGEPAITVAEEPFYQEVVDMFGDMVEVSE